MTNTRMSYYDAAEALQALGFDPFSSSDSLWQHKQTKTLAARLIDLGDRDYRIEITTVGQPLFDAYHELVAQRNKDEWERNKPKLFTSLALEMSHCRLKDYVNIGDATYVMIAGNEWSLFEIDNQPADIASVNLNGEIRWIVPAHDMSLALSKVREGTFDRTLTYDYVNSYKAYEHFARTAGLAISCDD